MLTRRIADASNQVVAVIDAARDGREVYIGVQAGCLKVPQLGVGVGTWGATIVAINCVLVGIGFIDGDPICSTHRVSIH